MKIELLYNHKWRKIWKLDDNHELVWSHGAYLDGKAWRIEKWDDDETYEKGWAFSTKRDAMKFWQHLMWQRMQQQ